MSLRDDLQAIYRAHGKLTPALVVEAARAPDHPLNPRFEWDNAICGDRYREIQAAEMIRSVTVVFTDGHGRNQRVREYWAVERREEAGYVSLDTVVNDDLTIQLLLRQAEREWKDLRQRYGHLREFVEAVRADVA